MLERLGVVCKYIFCCGCFPRTRGYSRNLAAADETSITYAAGPWGDDITVSAPSTKKKKAPVTSSKNQLTFAIMTVACTPNNNLMSPALTGQ